ncbi:GNAT family N-acetyltransferase [Pseudocolwellia sp. HL-MZ7]|uniref:GNAT family N-acetyltransferase n=1 Tax=Pseudocolwellia sp. HL-MZ7 TaxID=3400627 RepID=UPI003CE93FA5
MKLIKPLNKHLLEMTQWFANQGELIDWSGSTLDFPLTVSSFSAELNINVLSSFVLLSEHSDMLAFGQFYLRLNRCHLARLIVNPLHRGKGIAAKLIEKLSIEGCNELGVKECSLFVLEHNKSAIKAYNKYGFTVTTYPEVLPEAHCLYMVKN